MQLSIRSYPERVVSFRSIRYSLRHLKIYSHNLIFVFIFLLHPLTVPSGIVSDSPSCLSVCVLSIYRGVSLYKHINFSFLSLRLKFPFFTLFTQRIFNSFLWRRRLILVAARGASERGDTRGSAQWSQFRKSWPKILKSTFHFKV